MKWRQQKQLRRLISFGFAVVFGAQTVLPSAALAQTTAPLWLPPPGVMLAPSDPFAPAVIRGLRVNPETSLRFDFIIDTGHTALLPSEQEIEFSKLIRYFLAALTVPEDELWVNLSPYESDRIIPQKFGLTEMGRDLLAQDYALKQLTASLFDPKKDLGAKFWERARALARERFGVEDIDVETFNKVWVLPEKAVVYESGDVAFIVESRLKVMLEADYFALDEHSRQRGPRVGTEHERPTNTLASQVIREVIVPEIEKEVNEGEHFAPLRQAYHALILAAWFKQNLKESVVGQVYVEQNKVKGVDLAQADDAARIYQQYLEAFKVGVYDYIEEEYDPLAQTIIPKKYFSGGTNMAMLAGDALKVEMVTPEMLADASKKMREGNLAMVTADLAPADAAMATGQDPLLEYKNRVYPKTTFEERNLNDVVRIISKLISGMNPSLKKIIIVDYGIGATGGSTVDIKKKLEKGPRGDRQIHVIGTELEETLPLAHIKLHPVIFDSIKHLITKAMEMETLSVSGLKFVVTKNGSPQHAGISEILVEYYRDNKLVPETLAVSPELDFIRRGQSDKSTESLFLRLMEELFKHVKLEKLTEMIRNENPGTTDLAIDYRPLERFLENQGVELIFSERLPNYQGNIDILTASNVVIHMSPEERADFLKTVEASLKTGGFAVIKTGIPVMVNGWGPDLYNVIEMFRKEKDGLVHLGILISNSRGKILGESDEEISKEIQKEIQKKSPNYPGAINQLLVQKGFPYFTQGPASDNVGGIDLNPNRLDIEKRGSGMNWSAPVDPAMLTPASVEGFVPVIIQIAPANLPMLLGMVEGDDRPGEWAETAPIGRL